MKLSNYLLCAILLLGLNSAVYAQYRTGLQDYYLAKSIEGNLFLKRLSIGGGLHIVPGTTDLHFMGFVNGGYVDTSFKKDFKAKNSYAFYLGSYVPLSLVSDNSMLVAEIEFMASISNFTYDSVALSTTTKISSTLQAIRVGMPISLEYRGGADVLLNRKVGVMYTLGAGFNLCIINSNDYDKVRPYQVLPFIKAELGFVVGIAMKIRGVYTFGNSTYNYTTNYNVARENHDQLESVFKGSNGYSLSLILMPFSVRWNGD